LLFVFIAILTLSGCKNDVADGDEVAYLSGLSLRLRGAATEDGYFFTDNKAMLHYFDFKTKKTVFVCDKPECEHQPDSNSTPSTCNALLPSSFFTVYKDSIYSFVNKGYNQMELRKRDLAGNNDQHVADIGGQLISDAIFYRDHVFYIRDKYTTETFNPETGTGEKTIKELCVRDLKGGKEKKIRGGGARTEYAFYLYQAKDGVVSFYEGGRAMYCDYDVKTGQIIREVAGREALPETSYDFIYNDALYAVSGDEQQGYFFRKSFEGKEREKILAYHDRQTMNVYNFHDDHVFFTLKSAEFSAAKNEFILYDAKTKERIALKNSFIKKPAFSQPEFATEDGVILSMMTDKKDNTGNYAGTWEYYYITMKDLKAGKDKLHPVYRFERDEDATITFSSDEEDQA
jgi:hypothetical protein